VNPTLTRSLLRPLALAAALAGCTWTAPTNDAGTRAFVIESLRVLHGRAPRSMGEVDALVALATHNGRAAVVDALIADAELVDHWTVVLADDLGATRGGDNPMEASCYGDPLLTPAQHVALAAHLRTATVNQPFCVPYVPVATDSGGTAGRMAAPAPPPPDGGVRADIDAAELKELGVEAPSDLYFTEEDLIAEAKAEPVPVKAMTDAELWASVGVEIDPTSPLDAASTEEDKEPALGPVIGAEIGHAQRTIEAHALEAALQEITRPMEPWQAAPEEEARLQEQLKEEARLAEEGQAATEASVEPLGEDGAAPAIDEPWVAGPADVGLDLTDPGLDTDALFDSEVYDPTRDALFAERDAAAAEAEALRMEADAAPYDLSEGATSYDLEAEARVTSGGSTLLMTCLPFNMNDAIRAGILGRSLWVAWRAQVVPDQVFIRNTDTFGYEFHASNRFWAGHLGRDPSCLSCHTSSYSTTDARPRNHDWDRFFPPAGTSYNQVDVEGSALTVVDGSSPVYGGLGGTVDYIRRMFRRDAMRPNTGSQGLRPWGMSTVCTNSLQWKGFQTAITTAHPDGRAGIGNITASSTRGPLDLMNQYPSFVNGFSYSSSALAAVNVSGTGGLSGAGTLGACLGCHDMYSASGSAPALSAVVPQISDQKLFHIVRHGSMSMPAIATSDAQAWAVIANLRNVQGLTGPGNVRYVDGEDGIANLLAQQIVNKVVEDIQGYRLTVGHGFPRNAQAGALMNELTRVFVGSGWSLQSLLRYIVLTNAFNRNAPAETWSSGGTPLKYELPMMAQPWAAEPPGGTHPADRNANGQGDLVHRENIPALLHHLHEALGWPEAAIIDNGLWPSWYLQTLLGRPSAHEATTGRHAVDLELLARWEKEIARCNKPWPVRAADVIVAPGVTATPTTLLAPSQWRDWIDVLRLNSTTWTARDQIVSLKTRLISDPDLSTTEETLFAQLLGVSSLSVSGSTVSEAGLRRACGVLLSTPDYLLRRLPIQPTTTSPSQEVCLEASCTKAQFCSTYTSRIQTLGYRKDCNGAWILIAGGGTGTATGTSTSAGF
jgi:hypothetical protein